MPSFFSPKSTSPKAPTPDPSPNIPPHPHPDTPSSPPNTPTPPPAPGRHAPPPSTPQPAPPPPPSFLTPSAPLPSTPRPTPVASTTNRHRPRSSGCSTNFRTPSITAGYSVPSGILSRYRSASRIFFRFANATGSHSPSTSARSTTATSVGSCTCPRST